MATVDDGVLADSVADAVPDKMRAVVFDGSGGPEVLRAQRVATPQLKTGEVLVRVAAAGVNRPDVVQRMGLYPAPPGASPLPGLEVAGTVVALGEGAPRELLGSDVCALANGGGYAQFCAVPAGQCLPVPDGFSMAQAAALPETFFTVWHNLFNRAFARDGETALVHGGTSGIGTTAILLGKLFGLTMIVTCGSDAKCDAARRIGADHAINYKSEDFVERVKEITGGKGLEIVLDMVAGDYVPRNLDCLCADGRHVTIAVQGGVKAELNMAQIMVRRLTLTGSTLRPQSNARKAGIADELAREVWPALSAGEIAPVMDRSFALEDAADAHRHMEAGAHIGKIVLTVE